MNFDLDVKALAYPLNLPIAKPVSPCPCSLIFRCDDAKCATLLLVFAVPTAHSDLDSEFVLQYDGDNLVPNDTKLSTGKGHLKQLHLNELPPVKGKGKKRLDIKTLELSSNMSPPVWCSASTPTFSPRPGCEPAVQRLSDLSKATTIHIVFDFNQLHQHYHSTFKAFAKAARGLSCCPVEASLIARGLRKANWEVFAPTEAAGAPPAYESSSVRKRRRQESSSSPLQPARCWTPQSPAAESYTTEKTIPISPEAEVAALKRAQLEYQTSVIDAIVEEKVAARIQKLTAVQVNAIDAAVARRVDAYLAGPLHAETMHATINKHVDAAVQAHLPNAVQDLLVPQVPASSPAQSFTSIDSHGNRYPKLPDLTPAAKMLLPHLKTHLTAQFRLFQDQQLQRFEQLLDAKYDDVARAAEDDRVREQGEWELEREEHNTDILLLKKDTTDDLWREGQEMLEQGKHICQKLGEDMEEQLFGLVREVEKLNRYSLRRLMAAELAKLPLQTKREKGIPKGFGRNLLTHPNPKLLGKKIRRDSEWEDV